MDIAIKIDNLTKLYSNKRGIDSLCLEVPKGEVFGLLGPNGAGKTTAMKIMTGLMRPDCGDVYLDGHSITTDYEAAMSKVGCIIENVSMFPYLTALENMRLCARFYSDVDDERIMFSLRSVGMERFATERVKNFSLGMRQRMGIAMAILANPDILILDEPLNGLDVEGMVSMRKIFRELAQEHGTTVFISSHLIHDVELTCDRVGIVLGGMLKDVAAVDSLLESYSSLENYYISEVNKNA